MSYQPEVGIVKNFGASIYCLFTSDPDTQQPEALFFTEEDWKTARHVHRADASDKAFRKSLGNGGYNRNIHDARVTKIGIISVEIILYIQEFTIPVVASRDIANRILDTVACRRKKVSR